MEVANPMIGTLFINGGEQGWAEKYWLPDNTFASAITNFNKLCQWRASVLPRDFRLVWARVVFADKARNSKAAITAPLLPNDDGTPGADTAGYGPVNKTEDAVLYRFEVATGEFANRIWRGFVDQQIADDELAAAITVPATPPAAVPAGITADYLVNFGSFISYVMNNTVYSHVISNKPKNYGILTWERAIFRRTAMRRTGRSFLTSRGRR